MKKDTEERQIIRSGKLGEYIRELFEQGILDKKKPIGIGDLISQMHMDMLFIKEFLNRDI